MKRPIFLFLVLILFVSLIEKVNAQTDGPASLPRKYINTELLDISNYTTIKVSSSVEFQKILNSADCSENGTIIKIEPGTYIGNFVLPAKSCSLGKWIIIQTNTSNIPSPGNRIDPSYSGSLAKVITNNSLPAIRTDSGANNYRLIGLEIGVSNDVGSNHGVFVVGDSEISENALPENIILDRIYIHGKT